MTKEELRDELDDYREILDEFFSQNVCIPKGVNRHPDADVLHALAEDVSLPAEYICNGNWEEYEVQLDRFRIKPSEPVYEYRVRMNFKDKSFEYTEKYFTKQEFDDFGFPSSCELAEATKQERKQ